MSWPNNLPRQLTSFVGREHELDEVLALVRSNPLVTLTGTGGSGKTRLAIQAADLSRASFPDGAWLVELASISDSSLLAQIVANTMGVREEPDRPLIHTVAHYLQPLRLLLVLDNCEHLVDGAASIARRLLRECPGLSILATGRQGLGIDGEVTWRVPSLSAPRPRASLSAGDLSGYEAVQLFVERARQRRSDFVVSDHNAVPIAQLCYRLDGIPLAIELAAARISVLSIEQIVQRLDEQFRLLASGSDSALPRHKTLQAMMDWSYNLLTERESAFFRALSVFAGGFVLEAAAIVEGRQADEFTVIDLLSQLVDKSLVLVEDQGGQARYHLLETIRQYAWKMARAEGEHEGLLERHLAWCVELTERTEDELVSQRQEVWLERLEQEHDNLRAALAYSTSMSSSIGTARSTRKEWMGLRLAGALIWFWYFHSYLSEGRGWLESILGAVKDPAHDVALAKALSASGVLAFLQSEYDLARARLEDSLAIWTEIGDKRGTAFALAFLGRALAQCSDPRHRQYAEMSVELFREIGDKWGLALSLDFLGEEAGERGDHGIAYSLHEESLQLYRELGHHWGIALELSHFGRVSLFAGDYTDARRRLEEAVRIQREVGDKSALAWTLSTLGEVVLAQNDLVQAETYYRESLSLFREVEHRGGMANLINKVTGIAIAKGDYDEAWNLATESANLHRSLDYRWGMIAARIQLGTIARARGELTGARTLFRDALSQARALGDDNLVASAVEQLAALAAAQEDWEQAALLLGVAQKIVEDPLGTWHEVARAGGTTAAGEAQAHLGEQTFASLYQRGQALPQVEGIAIALHGRPESPRVHEVVPPAAPAINGHEAPEESDDLTRRELEVLRLIAEGLTDAQVAKQLVLSTRTVQAHVRSIYSKLNISTRSSATRYAIGRGLL